MASNSDNSAVGMPQLDFSTFPNQIFWLVVFCVVLFAIVKLFIIPRMEDIFANRRKIIDGNIAKAEEIRLRVSEIEKQIEEELQKAKSQCDEIMNASGHNIKEQMASALEDSKIATAQLISEAEGRLKELRDGSEAAIEKISEELASEIISKISRGK
jgi:F-type H+-transporting ATPase subunit b